jgi:uncharacterized small protein (DUF1192 family)
MSTLWTPGGERPVRADPDSEPSRPSPPAAGDDAGEELSEDELKARMEALQNELARTPPEIVIANHAYGLFELAGLHLSLRPPQLVQARVAIDAFAALVEGMAGRLGEADAGLQEALSQLRMAYVQLHAAEQAAGTPPAD